MKTDHRTTARPISPHLQVYKPQLTSVLSILHRISGVALAGGALLLVYWLASIAGGEASFVRGTGVITSFFGRILLFLFSLAAFYHLCNGIRHLYWDSGRGFELESVYRSGYVVVAASVLLTLLTWILAYVAR